MGFRLWALSLSVLGIGMFVSSLYYPRRFEWCFGLISDLLSHRDNPRGYVFADSAVIVAPLLLIPVFLQISRALGNRDARLERAALVLGITGLSVAALVGVEKLIFGRYSNRVRKLHEILAGTAFLCIMTFGVRYGLLYVRTRTARWQRILTVALVSFVPLGMGVTQGYLRRYRPELGWVGPDWKELGIPVILSFAVWQWLFLITSYATLFLLLQAASSMRNRGQEPEALIGSRT